MAERKWWITESIPNAGQNTWYGIGYRKEDGCVLYYDALTTQPDLLYRFMELVDANTVEDCHIEDVLEDFVDSLYLPPQESLA